MTKKVNIMHEDYVGGKDFSTLIKELRFPLAVMVVMLHSSPNSAELGGDFRLCKTYSSWCVRLCRAVIFSNKWISFFYKYRNK